MTLAGYNPNKGPEAFTLLASEHLAAQVVWGGAAGTSRSEEWRCNCVPTDCMYLPATVIRHACKACASPVHQCADCRWGLYVKLGAGICLCLLQV